MGKLINRLKHHIDKFYYFFYKNKILTINHNNQKIRLINNSPINFYRIKSFSNKEPMTLKWIDTFEKNSIFFDIGANIGLYSIYAAKSRDTIVYGFEASFNNLRTFHINTSMNNLSNMINIIPNSLYSSNKINKFSLNSNVVGDANNSVTETTKNKNFYKTNSLNLNTFFDIYSLKNIDYLKIDVDGNELDILIGSLNILNNVKSILIELSYNHDETSKIINLLEENNFYIKQKERLNNSNYNCIFVNSK